MAMGAAFGSALLSHIFDNAALANVGDAGGLQPSATAGSCFIALHTADPTAAGNQTSNECSYTNYGRVAVARSAGGWTISTTTVSNTAQVQFGQCNGGSSTATYFSVGLLTSGAGQIIMSGQLNSPLAISNGITPLFAIGALQATIS